MIVTLLIAFLSLIALMIIHEFGHFIIAKKFGVKVEEFGIGYPPRLFGKQFGETIYSVNLIPLGAFVRIYGEEGGVDDYRSFVGLAIWKRILIVLGGVLAFWIASAIIFSFVFFIGASVPVGDQDVVGVTSTQVLVMAVQADSPAQKAGLKPKDEIVGFNKIADFQAFIEANKGAAASLTFKRDGKEMTVSLTPRVTYPEGQGPTGVALERVANVIEKAPWYLAPVKGIMFTGEITWAALAGVYGFFTSIFSGQGVPPEAQLAGPVGITIFLSKAADYGVGFFLYFIGSLSVLLAIFNLFPIPALDGGKLLFLIIEKIQKKPVPVNWEQGLTILCFVLLITMSIFITVKFDIPRVVELWRAGL
ncbi:MAG: hypothetical protein A3C50_00795 [Candidatus Staskawiczbacteria bacterium RIFCSPHIGHO2_02_FULL_43_16]|uniref:PDZ domain-containing protein n=1 Tax=Candidatus Staskawiczbacteria bacterium RIFCSPHIGHO2_01_FULL_41_41 TaxID=1802203 RepID=A0A1G2HTU4_9BACT|nr:MAG: hypothetical protein A2822_00095 [Candidatus Staskawiczbacteria bacterium RIFCSPHIGHO2_01_FULL_41_41]OGZ68292.1 MAG: hypothetical protein A3C50_00795 [Candidatus Staskawiczbacteria bacterium RIFCSPHIGHO2_02_FULL_43_16]OGZ74681.1 MAG: hypothetical protein A3A12_00885 [Candidatus Staskawiczbacteria bacterium RIFCSPLOWO2_01_FULL_43_17b]